MAELDPKDAAARANAAMLFLSAFDTQTFSDLDAQPFDRRHLGIALDYIQELAAMVMNLAPRVFNTDALTNAQLLAGAAAIYRSGNFAPTTDEMRAAFKAATTHNT